MLWYFHLGPRSDSVSSLVFKNIVLVAKKLCLYFDFEIFMRYCHCFRDQLRNLFERTGRH